MHWWYIMQEWDMDTGYDFGYEHEHDDKTSIQL
jgi:hypothetical protein